MNNLEIDVSKTTTGPNDQDDESKTDTPILLLTTGSTAAVTADLLVFGVVVD